MYDVYGRSISVVDVVGKVIMMVYILVFGGLVIGVIVINLLGYVMMLVLLF